MILVRVLRNHTTMQDISAVNLNLRKDCARPKIDMKNHAWHKLPLKRLYLEIKWYFVLTSTRISASGLYFLELQKSSRAIIKLWFIPLSAFLLQNFLHAVLLLNVSYNVVSMHAIHFLQTRRIAKLSKICILILKVRSHIFGMINRCEQMLMRRIPLHLNYLN